MKDEVMRVAGLGVFAIFAIAGLGAVTLLLLYARWAADIDSPLPMSFLIPSLLLILTAIAVAALVARRANASRNTLLAIFAAAVGAAFGFIAVFLP